jgi:hypothetical protein
MPMRLATRAIRSMNRRKIFSFFYYVKIFDDATDGSMSWRGSLWPPPGGRPFHGAFSAATAAVDGALPAGERHRAMYCGRFPMATMAYSRNLQRRWVPSWRLASPRPRYRFVQASARPCRPARRASHAGGTLGGRNSVGLVALAHYGSAMRAEQDVHQVL